MSNRNPDPNTPRQDVGDEDAQAGVVDQDADQYRLTRGELTRVRDDGTTETISEGDVFDATDDEIRSFGDLLEPADKGGVGQPVAEQPIPENAGADYESRGERGEREPNPGAHADADAFEDANVTPDAVDDQDTDDLGEVDQPVPEQTNADYESRGEQGERAGVDVPEANDFAEPDADVDQEALGGPAETQPEDRAEVEKPSPSEDAATETVEDQTEADSDAVGDADADAGGESGNADAPDDADGEAEAAIDAVPSDYDSMNVGDVRDYVRSENPDVERLQALLKYEEDNKDRTTITDDLEERIADATDSDGGE